MIWCFELPFFVLYRSSGVPVIFDQNLPEDQAPVEVLVQGTSQDKVPNDKVVEKAPEQVVKPTVELDPVVILTPYVEVVAPEGPQQVPTPVGNPSQPNKFPFVPLFIDDKELDEAWRRISDHQIKIGPDIIFADYNEVAIRVSIYDQFHSFPFKSLQEI